MRDIRENHFILAPERNAVYEGFTFKKMVNQEDHGFIFLTPGGQNFIELVKRTTAIDYKAHHFEIAECHTGNLEQR